jgi:hypothetical protein
MAATLKMQKELWLEQHGTPMTELQEQENVDRMLCLQGLYFEDAEAIGLYSSKEYWEDISEGALTLTLDPSEWKIKFNASQTTTATATAATTTQRRGFRCNSKSNNTLYPSNFCSNQEHGPTIGRKRLAPRFYIDLRPSLGADHRTTMVRLHSNLGARCLDGTGLELLEINVREQSGHGNKVIYNTTNHTNHTNHT